MGSRIKMGALIGIGALIDKKKIRRGALIRKGALIGRRALNRIITVFKYDIRQTRACLSLLPFYQILK